MKITQRYQDALLSLVETKEVFEEWCGSHQIKGCGRTRDMCETVCFPLAQIIEEDLEEWAKANSYVKLAEDQTTLPEGNLDNHTAIILFKAGWRKVELEG